jgi:hypothetical protein
VGPRRVRRNPTNRDVSVPVRTAIPDGPAEIDPAISSWEVIYFANMRAPGIATVTGGRRRIVDPRLIPGSSGQIPTVMAFMPAEFVVTLLMWDPAQWASFKTLADILHPKPSAAQLQSVQQLQAIDVYHPAFRSLNVNSVYVVDIRAPSPGPIPQTMIAVIDCFEFLPPLNEGVKPIQSSAAEVQPGIFTPPAQPAARTSAAGTGHDQPRAVATCRSARRARSRRRA